MWPVLLLILSSIKIVKTERDNVCVISFPAILQLENAHLNFILDPLTMVSHIKFRLVHFDLESR